MSSKQIGLTMKEEASRSCLALCRIKAGISVKHRNINKLLHFFFFSEICSKMKKCSEVSGSGTAFAVLTKRGWAERRLSRWDLRTRLRQGCLVQSWVWIAAFWSWSSRLGPVFCLIKITLVRGTCGECVWLGLISSQLSLIPRKWCSCWNTFCYIHTKHNRNLWELCG